MSSDAIVESDHPPPSGVSDSDLFGGTDFIDLQGEDNIERIVKPSKRSRKGSKKKTAEAAAIVTEDSREEEEELKRLRAEAVKRNAERAEALARAQQAEEDVFRRAYKESKDSNDVVEVKEKAGVIATDEAGRFSPNASSDRPSPTRRSRTQNIVSLEKLASSPPPSPSSPTSSLVISGNSNAISSSGRSALTRELRHTSIVANQDSGGYTCKECGMVFADMIVAELHRNTNHS